MNEKTKENSPHYYVRSTVLGTGGELLIIVINLHQNNVNINMEFQVDITPEEFHNSIKSEVAVHSDIKPFTEALTQKLAEKKFTLEPASNNWWQALKTKQKANTEFVQVH